MRIPVLVLAVVIAAFVACSKSSTPPDATYQVRGLVTAVGPTLEIQHEAIPDYVGRTGKQGMAAMVMDFHVAPTVSIAEISAGTKVAFTFKVRWSSTPALEILAISPLPADTVLVLDAM